VPSAKGASCPVEAEPKQRSAERVARLATKSAQADICSEPERKEPPERAPTDGQDCRGECRPVGRGLGPRAEGTPSFQSAQRQDRAFRRTANLNCPAAGDRKCAPVV